VPNLLLNVGHGALGFTLAAGSAQIVADVVKEASTGLRPDQTEAEPLKA
jgi:glycine/D-amino acid oxidase-like deaminating enzyme